MKKGMSSVGMVGSLILALFLIFFFAFTGSEAESAGREAVDALDVGCEKTQKTKAHYVNDLNKFLDAKTHRFDNFFKTYKEFKICYPGTKFTPKNPEDEPFVELAIAGLAFNKNQETYYREAKAILEDNKDSQNTENIFAAIMQTTKSLLDEQRKVKSDEDMQQASSRALTFLSTLSAEFKQLPGSYLITLYTARFNKDLGNLNDARAAYEAVLSDTAMVDYNYEVKAKVELQNLCLTHLEGLCFNIREKRCIPTPDDVPPAFVLCPQP